MSNFITSATKYNTIEKELFSTPKRHCDECGTRLSKSKRNHVVIRHKQRGVKQEIIAGFELCNRCTRSFEKNSLPNISRATEATFLDSLECLGGVQ